MIKQSIKQYEEFSYASPTTTYPATQNVALPTQLEVDLAIKEAKEKVTLGDLFDYKSGTGRLRVTGFDHNPLTVSRYKDKLAVVWLERLDNGSKYHYALNELFDSYMIKVEEVDEANVALIHLEGVKC